jgi:integrase
MVHGKRRDIGLGGFPLVSLAEAREQAAELRKIARRGGDPLAARDKEHSPVFRLAAERVHEAYKASWKNKKHADQWINTLKTYAFPVLGDSRVDQIRSEHVVRALAQIWLLKPETARRVLQRIQSVLLWAKGHGFRTDNPTDEIAAARRALPKQSRSQRHHKALPYDDVPDFIKSVHRSGASEQIKLALEFLILTAARTGEVLGAQWAEIDWQQRVWIIPAPRMKAEREHQVPLSSRSIEMLKAAQQLCEDPKGYIFPGTIPGKPLSNMALLMLVRRMGIKVTNHGFRSTFRMWCAEQTSYAREVAEAALAHVVKDATEAAYMRSTFFEKRRQLMSDWAAYTAHGEDGGIASTPMPAGYVSPTPSVEEPIPTEAK